MKQDMNDAQSYSIKTPKVLDQVEISKIRDKRVLNGLLPRFTSKPLVETRGIERVLPEDRTDTSLWHIVAVWWSANIGISTMSVGILGPAVFRLSLRQTYSRLTFKVFGNRLHSIFRNACSTDTPCLLTISALVLNLGSVKWLLHVSVLDGSERESYVYWNFLFGWDSIGLILSSQILFAMTKAISYRLSILIFAFLGLIVPVLGYEVLHKFQSYAYIPSLISVIIVLVQLGRNGSFTVSAPMNLNKTEAVLNFSAAIFGGGIGWASTGADYNVMRPADTKRTQIYFVSYASLMLSMAPSEVVGAACGTTIFANSRYADAYQSDNIGGLLSEVLESLGHTGKMLCFAMFLFASISSTILSKYSTGFVIQTLGNRALMVPRWVWTIVGSVIATGIALVGAKHFSEALTNMLGIIGYWMSIYTCIVLEEHIIFRSRYGYKLDDWNTPSRLPVGIAAGAASIFGITGAVLGMQQPWFTGAIAKLIGSTGGDIGFGISAL
ncbi:Purine-cytosine permease fcyB [Neolecta irregularis DAH-3]|uniref:Purine-cytosine permease fcyB n=1 Tax=Neolecta irregularis (strain DAH-3) TaxID=1198029 RepID=A0A1U7LLX0_NEOID|nr:Purine-cytosine permease fcyB [Neolecta irregularis DAH-3]|eukprot:OLL23511.1 Purine-cytosine permease fcyB [Neolecta irregularis DAH-3]